ncbi:uncharacterized protein [Haliotis cracherodii]|uniref:uncharacterized protein n=1 Tax=Haliotis cracherodii TaxID=6455 RepID=UPI0039EA62FD
MVSFRRWCPLLLVVAGAFLMLFFEHVVLPHFSYRTADTSRSSSSKTTPSTGKTLVYRFNGRKIEQLHDFCTWSVNFDCVPLKSQSGETPIHIHDIMVDHWVSKDIKLKGAWEPGNIHLILSELKKDPELGFLDLGSHVGAFSLSVAMFGRKVVSVDPLIENVQRLCKSIQKGGFTDRMTILFNPVGANHSLVSFKREDGNVGGTSVVAPNRSSSQSPCDESTDSYTITLDDTLPYLPFKKAFIKVDIQEYEYYVLNGTDRFFKEIEVPGIFMEWELMKSDINGKNLVDLLSGLKYSAYEPRIGGRKLDPNQYQSWPFDVLWKK